MSLTQLRNSQEADGNECNADHSGLLVDKIVIDDNEIAQELAHLYDYHDLPI